jgi:hypothetical protein
VPERAWGFNSPLAHTHDAGQAPARPASSSPTLDGMWFLILLVVVVAAYVVYRLRVPLLAKILGQPQDRIERRLNRRRDR